MSQNRSRHNVEFKTKVALTALTEAKTFAEISSEFKAHSSQVPRWKQELIENAAEPFGWARRMPLTTVGIVVSLVVI